MARKIETAWRSLIQSYFTDFTLTLSLESPEGNSIVWLHGNYGCLHVTIEACTAGRPEDFFSSSSSSSSSSQDSSSKFQDSRSSSTKDQGNKKERIFFPGLYKWICHLHCGTRQSSAQWQTGGSQQSSYAGTYEQRAGEANDRGVGAGKLLL
eukprot:1141946-Pelagomonas_calceolata.AAC.4